MESLEVCQYAIRMASEAESHMTSVERVLNYTNIEPEPGYNTDTVPDASWPTVGSLTLHDLSLSYLKDAPAVLKSININVAAKEKITGVVGRTGAGKSSLVAALFRMPEPEGQVRNVPFRFRCYYVYPGIITDVPAFNNSINNNDGRHGLRSGREDHHRASHILDIFFFYQYIIFHHRHLFRQRNKTEQQAPTIEL